MGRTPRPTKSVRIPLSIYERIRARARHKDNDITVEVVELLEFGLENKDKLSPVHMLGSIEGIIEDYARMKRRNK